MKTWYGYIVYNVAFIFVFFIFLFWGWNKKREKIYTFELLPASSTEYCNIKLKFSFDTVESVLVKKRNLTENDNFSESSVLATTVVPSECNNFTDGQQWYYLFHLKSGESYRVEVRLKENTSKKFKYLGATSSGDHSSKVENTQSKLENALN